MSVYVCVWLGWVCSGENSVAAEGGRCRGGHSVFVVRVREANRGGDSEGMLMAAVGKEDEEGCC